MQVALNAMISVSCGCGMSRRHYGLLSKFLIALPIFTEAAALIRLESGCMSSTWLGAAISSATVGYQGHKRATQKLDTNVAPLPASGD